MRNIKILSLGAISTGFFITACIWIDKLIFGQHQLSLWFWPTIFLAFFSTSAIFYFMLKKPWFYDVSFLLLNSLIAILIFPKTWFMVIGSIIFLLVFYGFKHRLQLEANNRLDFHIRPVAESALHILIYGFLILIAVNVYLLTEKKIAQDPNLMYQGIARSAINNFFTVSKSIGLKFDGNQSLDELLLQSLQKRSQDVDPSVFKEQLNKVISLERDLNNGPVSTGKSGSTTSSITGYFTEFLTSSLKPFERFLPLLFALATIGILRLFGFIFEWLTIFLTWGIFHILLSLKFFKFNEEAVIVKKLDV